MEISPSDIGPAPKLSRDDYIGTWTLTIREGNVTIALVPPLGGGFVRTDIALFAKPDRFIIDHINNLFTGFGKQCARYESYI